MHKGSTNENKIEHKTQFQNSQGSNTETNLYVYLYVDVISPC